ncbi:MAG: permease-like cell division protein FtsX [Actinomycetota bacterium]|nr:permease-like cell division protein FtsX [Actinomycetota bacterium]
MQLSYVLSDLATGIKRNVSMVISLVLTIAVSLTLVALGLLVRAQVDKIEQSLGSRLQVVVLLCNDNSTAPTCVSGQVTEDQKAAIAETVERSPYVESYRLESQQQAYEKFRDIYITDNPDEQRLYASMQPSDFKESYWITLRDPKDYEQVGTLVQGLPGVDSVQDLRDVLNPVYNTLEKVQIGALVAALLLLLAAVFQVANTIRLAAFARRREIGIMRLVGASSVYIQLPFVLESLLAAVVGIGFAAAGVAVLLLVAEQLQRSIRYFEWVDWSDGVVALGWVAALGVTLALIPTLWMTRKYLRV